jgi:hypothetical protein
MTTPKTCSAGSIHVAREASMNFGLSSAGIPSFFTPPQTISSGRMVRGASSRSSAASAGSIFANRRDLNAT